MSIIKRTVTRVVEVCLCDFCRAEKDHTTRRDDFSQCSLCGKHFCSNHDALSSDDYRLCPDCSKTHDIVKIDKVGSSEVQDLNGNVVKTPFG